MSDIQAIFDIAADDCLKRKSKMDELASQDQIKKIYGYYKQATIGDCNIPQPSHFHPIDRAKWGVWNSLCGMKPLDAAKSYISLASKITGVDYSKKYHDSFDRYPGSLNRYSDLGAVDE